MPKLKLSYFDFEYGRAEPARLVLSMAGIPFEDDRIPYQDWPKRKAEMPFGIVPVLYVDGQPLSQSNSINRFVGKLTGFYPSDPWQAALCDEAMDAVEDITKQIVAAMKTPEELKKAKFEELVSGMFSVYLSRFEKHLEANGGRYFADHRLTVADLKVFDCVGGLRAGKLKELPVDLVERVAPGLLSHSERIQNDPRIKAYYDARGVSLTSRRFAR